MPTPITRRTPDEVTLATAPTRATRLFWAELAKRPSARAPQKPLQRCIKKPKQAFLRARYPPAGRSTTGARLCPVARTFRGVPCRPTSALCWAPYAIIPKRAVRNLFFVSTTAWKSCATGRSPTGSLREGDFLTSAISRLSTHCRPTQNPQAS